MGVKQYQSCDQGIKLKATPKAGVRASGGVRERWWSDLWLDEDGFRVRVSWRRVRTREWPGIVAWAGSGLIDISGGGVRWLMATRGCSGR
ncbi:hypothetical protein Drorol1_Dr00011889 [Drosera rotundifolia]